MHYNKGEMVACIRDILTYIGEDTEREGLVGTPLRVVKSWEQLYSGYEQDPADIFTTFVDGACDEMVILKHCEFHSTCIVGSTFVETPRGRIPIQYLKDGDFIYSFNEDSMEFEIEKCFNPRITRRNASLVRIYSDRDTLLCTPEHLVLKYDGPDEVVWVQAKDLIQGDRVVSLYRGLMDGYIVINMYSTNGKKEGLAEHRVVYEGANKRKLEKNEQIHHIDRNPSNNDPRNLTALTKSKHSLLHRFLEVENNLVIWRQLWTDEQREYYETARKQALEMVHRDPERRKIMVEKRKNSVKLHWDSMTEEERSIRVNAIRKGIKEKRGKNRTNHRIISVEDVPWKEDVWCMDVQKNENFIANGMVIHNCEHHMLPFIGQASIGYIPNGKVIGVSKLVRLLEIYTRRLQIQERICQQVTQALDKYLQPLGSACILEASHLCMTCRGVMKQNSMMVTSSLTGEFLKHEVRQEFLSLIRN